ncbi:Kinase, AGC [Spironucleus salmonicida]|uniref:non-specific serine/threonine protein kinase n=1 Tax=Spironucleus salmonicida TaxID=348837 RepID=V6LEB9_9EUKA|nr:Kinase, AGC [Spironucleus salmonicida]|eukprot:EST42822.1 Kinase, AGC [Spironucleus salmonicida]
MTLPPPVFPTFLRSYLASKSKRPDNRTLETQYLRTLRRKLNLDQFSIINTIGKGAFSLVYLVQDRLNLQFYALKAIDKTMKTSSTAAQLERDVMLKMEKSPFLVSLKATFQDAKNYYILMEFCQGGDLMGLMIRETLLPEQKMKFYAAEIIVAIQAVHESGYLYLDLKPDNVLINKAGHVKLADFNLVREENEQVRIQGTLDYMSPEMLQKQQISVKSDIWSIGAVLYEGVVGKVPFLGENKQQTAGKIVKFDISYPEFLSGSLVHLLKQIFVEADKRINLAEIIDHQFFKGVDFSKLLEISPPFVPKFQNQMDLQYFDAVGVGFQSGRWWGENVVSKGEFTYQAFPGTVEAEENQDQRTKITKLFDNKKK